MTDNEPNRTLNNADQVNVLAALLRGCPQVVQYGTTAHDGAVRNFVCEAVLIFAAGAAG
jgi:hypothetical protein